MRIKQSTFYAMRILYRIHLEGDPVVTSREIAGKEGISPGVTLKILRELTGAGMVQARQGRGQVCGGFALAKGIEEITMADVVGTLEGLDVGVNLDRGAGPLYRAVGEMNGRLEGVFSEYSIKGLFRPEGGQPEEGEAHGDMDMGDRKRDEVLRHG